MALGYQAGFRCEKKIRTVNTVLCGKLYEM